MVLFVDEICLVSCLPFFSLSFIFYLLRSLECATKQEHRQEMLEQNKLVSGLNFYFLFKSIIYSVESLCRTTSLRGWNKSTTVVKQWHV